MTFVLASNDIFFQVDLEDLTTVSQYRWTIARFGEGLFYVTTNLKGKTMYLHRILTGVESSEEVDHINGNGLNNCRSNLRIVSHALNLANQRPQVGRSSQYKGVSYYKSRGNWEAYIKINKHHHHLGYFLTEVAAAKAYDQAAQQAWGEYARLNFPDTGEVV
jgi:hypothetical protein